MSQRWASAGVSRTVFCVGLLLLVAYWYSIHPIGFARGYSEDLCTDIVRQMMAENLQKFGGPKFRFEQYMAPYGASMPFMSWTIERDWIGAYFWMWNRDFPFLWVYFGLSLLFTYLGVGFILKKMKFVPATAWAITTAVVLFHIPRHFKIWHHFEHLPQHWIYLSLFMDAWIWQRFFREKRWSWNLELWRGILLLGMTWSTGYFWGALVFEWMLVRGFLLWTGAKWKKLGTPVQVEGTVKGAALPVGLGLVMLAITLRWFLPLYAEVKGIGEVPQGMAWYAPFRMLPRPLWIYPLAKAWSAIFPSLAYVPTPVDVPETLVTVGWFYWMPAVLAFILIRKKKGGPGALAMGPMLWLLILGLNYAVSPHAHFIALAMYDYLPFMKFFRVASRWGLFMPQMITIVMLLAWPELRAWVQGVLSSPKSARRFKTALVAFAALSTLEFAFLFYPINMQPPIPVGLKNMLEHIRDTPGKTVLSLPFCVAGGNGVCTGEQCPNYPYSTTAACFREWHEKDVYGLYQARMLPSHCEIYNRAPYPTWFSVWREQRCLTDAEWNDFCSYLDSHTELSALLVFPHIWIGVETPECRAKLEARLGPALDEQTFLLSPTRGGQGANPTAVRWYPPKCRKVSP